MKDGIDSITRLAMNIYSNKGVYVPLLGSGVSLAAGIMSGWKVTEDLLKKLAFMQEGNIPEDLFSWYCDKYHKEAEYSDLLSQLGHHSAEIGNLLWSYFEPTEDDKRYHRKEPTKAHKAIAEIAAKGYFKVVVTTNFDRLLEDALDQKGVKYQVVSKETDIEGVVPLVHFPLTIFKINGDYKDSRVKNTEEELTNYSKQWNDYLHGILKDFGIVTCGWSATWDKAIIKAIENCKNHKYSYNFTYVDKANSNEIIRLSKECNGDSFGIDGADEFFSELSARINALEIIHNKDMEIDKEIAVARVKEYIIRDEDIIRYTDLFEKETSRVIQKAGEYTYSNQPMSAQLYNQIYSTAIANLSVILPMSIVATRWADDRHGDTIVNSLSDIANRPITINGSWTDDGKKQNHAVDTLYLYGIGTACVYYRNFGLLDKLFRIQLNDAGYLMSSYLIGVDNCWIIDKNIWNRTAQNKLKTPSSGLFNTLIRPSFTFINNQDEFDICFCIFEKLLAMYYYMLITSVETVSIFPPTAPIGQFGWQSLYFTRSKKNKYDIFFNEIKNLQDGSPQLKAGMFESSYIKYSEVLSAVNEIEKQARTYIMY